jgi:spore maturation protein CgeB
VTGIAAKLRRIPLATSVNAKLKGWLVEQDAAAIGRRYERMARRNRLLPPTGPAFQSAVRARVAQRAGRLGWPKPMGGLHIFLTYSLCNWEAVLPAAMAPFGEVSVFEWGSQGFDEAATTWLEQREAMNRAMLAAFESAQRRRPVDLVVGYLSGYNVAPEILEQMAANGAVITNFCFDDKIRWPGALRGGRYTSPAAIAHAVDMNLTSDPNGAVRYFAHGGLAMFHAEAADPKSYFPMEVTYEHDVSFVGACYGWRPRLIAGLKRLGIDVACFGKGWPRGPVSNEEMNGVYARSRINLGCGGVGYSSKLLCLKGRDFEVPMSGAVYLTQDNPELSQVFSVGEDILTYRGIDDCARTIRELLHDERRAVDIRRHARLRSLRDHTYEARWSGVFQTLGAIQ